MTGLSQTRSAYILVRDASGHAFLQMRDGTAPSAPLLGGFGAAQRTPASCTDQYRFEERLETSEDESAVLGMPLPEAHDWATLWGRDAGFREVAINGIRNVRGAQNAVRDLFKSRTQCDPDCVDDNVVRVWIFLLAARQMNPEEHDRLFGQAYFDGVTMPLASPTPKMVRVLRWIGDD